MKTKFKNIITSIILFFSLGINTSSGQITIFGNTVPLVNPLQQGLHNNNFLQLLNINQIYWVYSYNMVSSEMQTSYNVLMNHTSTQLPPGTPAKIMIYTTNPNGTNQIQLSHTHAFSVIMLYQGQLIHYYFERQNSNFSEINSLRTRINGKISDGIIRAIHFAAISNYGLPASSSVYVLHSNDFNLVAFNSIDNSLTKLFSADHFRQSGFFTTGLLGDSVFISARQVGGGGCDNRCSNGTAACVSGDCGGDGGCVKTSALNNAMALNVNLGVHFDFELSRNFRDNFLRKFEEGRDYIGFYYTFGRFAKMDVTSLFQYADVMPHLYAAMNALMSNTGDPVIITPALRNSALIIINNHRNIPDVEFQNILNRMEADLNRYVGMTKSNLIATLIIEKFAAIIPTLTQWGIIILTLLLLAVGMVFVNRRQNALVLAGDVTQDAKPSLFDRSLYFKVLGIVLLLAVMGLVVAYWYFGTLSKIDSFGTLVSAGIVAYMVQTSLLMRRK